MAIPILATKLLIPPRRPRDSVVTRLHLIERLNATPGQRLTLISAPAGYGKTTLLSEWIPHSERCVAWVSLDAAENDPTRFWTYFISALQMLSADLGESAVRLLQSLQPPPMESILTLLLNDISAFHDDFALVLDDYHVIDTPAIHAALTFLLDHLPPQMQVIMTSRSDPPLPLARWRVRRQLVEIRAADLRFTPNEAAAFLNQVMRLSLSASDIAALEMRTEGWIAGLQLAALSMQGRPDLSSFIQAFTGSHAYVIDYLAEEVVQRQTDDLQTFLQQTSILDRMCGALCDAVTGRNDSQAMLDMLQRRDLFVMPLDDERQWYQYHPLFADVLRIRLHQTQAGSVAGLNRRASAWYEEHGSLIDAVRHALAAKDFERAAQLLEQIGPISIVRGQTHTALAWLNALPDAIMRAFPQLCIVHAAALMFTNHLDAAEARIQDAEQFVQAHSAMSAGQVRDILGRAAMTRAMLVSLYGDLPQCVDLASWALNVLPESDLFWRASPLVHLASAYQLHGDVTPAHEHLALAAIAPARASGNLFTILRSITNLAHLQTLQGRLREAEATYRSTVQIVTGQDRLHMLVGSAAYYYGMGNLLRERNDLDAAELYFGYGLDMVKETLTVDADVVTFGHIALARLKQARGDSAGALEVLQEFMQLARQRKFVPRLIARGSTAQAQLLLAQGDLAAAVQWVKANDMRAGDVWATEYPHEFEYLTLARVLIAQGRHDPKGHYLRDALRLLDRLLEAAESQARMGSVIEVHLLRALALHAQGKPAEALAILERTLILAEPEGYVRIFVDEGEPMKLLISDFRFGITKQTTHLQSYVTQLLAAFPGTDSVTSASQIENRKSIIHHPPEPLSERESEVLRLIEAGLTNQEIAQKLVVAVSTVKKHINSIFSKLGVRSRTQALARARELSLL